MLFEIFDDGKFLGFEDAPHEEAAIVVFANKRHPRADPFKTLAEVRQDQGFPHREATAVAAYATMPPAEAATEVELSEYSKVFELLALADEAAATAARLRDAATRTSGLEREANTRQAAEAEAEATRIEAELQQPPEFSGLVPTQAKPDQGQAAPAEPRGSRQRQQEQDILQALRTLGHDPLRLPRPPAGTPGPKAEVRATLPKMTPKQFDKAWDRLRGFGDIQDAE